MNIKEIAKKIIPDFLIGRLGINHGIQKFAFDRGSSIRNDIQSKYGFHGDLLDFYVNNEKQIIHKWHHYIRYTTDIFRVFVEQIAASSK